MADNSHIEWTDATWNPVAGCSVVSPGCTNCYAMRSVAPRLSANPATPHYHGTAQPSKAGPVWTGKIGIASDQVLTQPLRWKRPRMIFVNSTSDLFHEGVPDAVIDRIFAVMALCPQHTFQVLTKRPERMREYLTRTSNDPERRLLFRIGYQAQQIWTEILLKPSMPPRPVWPLPNVWLGTSVEDQTRADERIPHLLATPAAVHFISAEPLLGPMDLSEHLWGRATPCPECTQDADCGCGFHPRGAIAGEPAVDWVIVGGESGRGARPMHPDWARSLRDQCAAAGVPFFFKQWGEWETALDRERDDPDWRRDYKTDFIDEGRSRWLNLAGGSGFHGERFHVMRRVGKRAAGRLLDGVEHSAMPEVHP